MKIRTGCQYVRYFHHSEHLNWAAKKLRLGRELDIVGLETGSSRKVSLSFCFVAASSKKSFHISIKSNNFEVKLCNFYQFLKRLMVLQVAKYFCPSIMFHHFTTNFISLMLSLHELQQVLVLVKQFTAASSIETFLSSRYYSHIIFFPISCLQTEESSQSI